MKYHSAKKNVINQLTSIFGIILSIACLYWVIRKIDLSLTLAELKQINPLYPLAMSVLYLFTFNLRALRWKMMLPTASFHRKLPYQAIVIGFAGNNVLPARGGEVVRMEFFKQNAGTSRMTVISSILIEKIIDGAVLMLFLLVTTWVLQDYLYSVSWFHQVYFTAIILFGTLLFPTLSVRAWGKRWALKWATTKAGVLFQNFYKAFAFIGADRATLIIFLLGIGIWLCEGLMFVLAVRAFHLSMPMFWGGLLLMVIVNFGILLPSSPGYLGVFQSMVLLTLSLFAISEQTAFSVAVLVHFCQFVPVTLWGGYLFARHQYKRMR